MRRLVLWGILGLIAFTMYVVTQDAIEPTPMPSVTTETVAT